MKHLLAFDLETTGLDTGNDRIIEFCFLSLDAELNVTGRYHGLVNPKVPIPPESTEIHGISDDDVAAAPPFSFHTKRIQELVDSSILVAHNGYFDMAVLNAELMRHGEEGLSPNHPLIDTLLIEKYVNSHKLEAAFERYEGGTFENAHRAEADTRATVAVLKGQMREHASKLPPEVDKFVTNEIKKLAGHEIKVFLDHDRRFFKDDDGVVRFNFGKHKGEDVQSRRGYLEWMLRREFSTDTLRVVNAILSS